MDTMNKPKIKTEFPKAELWVLINNFTHEVKRFTSVKLLRQYADSKKYFLKKSQVAEKTFYTEG